MSGSVAVIGGLLSHALGIIRKLALSLSLSLTTHLWTVAKRHVLKSRGTWA